MSQSLDGMVAYSLDADPGRAGAAAWRLRLRRKRLPAPYLAGVLAAITVLIAAPYAEELWRCAKASARHVETGQREAR